MHIFAAVPESVASMAGAEADFPVKSIPITLEQLLRVLSFNRMQTASLKLIQVRNGGKQL